MRRLATSIILCLAAIAGASADLDPWTVYGMDMSVKAFDAVCWYEYFKIFPKTELVKEERQCDGQAENIRKQMPTDDDDTVKQFYPTFTKQIPMTRIPDEYADTCNKYLDDINAKSPEDMSDALNDPNSGTDYVLKGFSNCLISTLKKRHGDKAIDAVKNERTHMTQDWRVSLFNRDNEYRERHGVPKFQMIKELNDAAQQWADVMSNDCNSHHSEKEQRLYKGKPTGESIAEGSSANDTTFIPYSTSNMWYVEVKNYPFPASCDTKNPCGDGGKVIGHFTQSVWKGSKYVGYGYTYNPDCKKWFSAARYFPEGNMRGQYMNNVRPPQ